MRGDPPPTARCFRLLQTGSHWVDGVKFAALWNNKVSYWWIEGEDIRPNGWMYFDDDDEDHRRDLENPDLCEPISYQEMMQEIDPDPYQGLDCGEDLGL